VSRQPKQLRLLSGGHFDAYTDGFEESSTAALAWSTEHLTCGEPRIGSTEALTLSG
jgi:hypothetical protein